MKLNSTFLPIKFMCVHAKSLPLCLTLYDPMDHSPLGSSVPGILQVRILEWVPGPPAGDLPNPGTEPDSFMHWQAGSSPLAPPGKSQGS